MPKLRISSGSAKNKNIKAPKIPGFRAVQEVAKSAIFSIIGQENVVGSTCLDLYSGSGNMGLEAISRGADWCDFVDNHKLSEKVINENLRKCEFEDRGMFYLSDSVKFVAETSDKYRVVFIDPFYTETSHKFLLKNVAEILEENGWVAFTHGKNLDIENLVRDTDLAIYTKRRYGASHLSILRKQAQKAQDKPA